MSLADGLGGEVDVFVIDILGEGFLIGELEL